MNTFLKKFTVAYCVTVYKYQGSEIDEDYCIWDVDLMDKKMMYTALSRTKKWDYVSLKYKVKDKHLFHSEIGVIV